MPLHWYPILHTDSGRKTPNASSAVYWQKTDDNALRYMGGQPASPLHFHFWIMKSSHLQYGGSTYISLSVHFRIESSLPFQWGPPLNSVRSRSTNKPHYMCAVATMCTVQDLHVANWFAGNKIRPAYFLSRCLWCIVHIWTTLCHVHVAVQAKVQFWISLIRIGLIFLCNEKLWSKNFAMQPLWSRLGAGVSLAFDWLGICSLVLLSPKIQIQNYIAKNAQWHFFFVLGLVAGVSFASNWPCICSLELFSFRKNVATHNF